jgi:hypothetical protein
MPTQQPKQNGAVWRSRREEYLRASGRQCDLVNEGFETALPAASWAVIAGGRRSRLPKTSPRPGLLLVKGVAS